MRNGIKDDCGVAENVLWERLIVRKKIYKRKLLFDLELFDLELDQITVINLMEKNVSFMKFLKTLDSQ